MLGKTLLACATFVVATVAQSQIIAFKNPPANITAGQSVELTWSGGDGSAVTLTLQQGLPSDLQTVQLITGSATGTSYTWPVPSSLPDASNYAFKIQQGDNPPNYTGMITLTGGQTTGPTLAVSALASTSSSSASTSASVSATSTVPTNPASGGVVGGGNNSTTTPAGNTTTTNAAAAGTGTAASGSGSAATGTALSRNTTMSIATLTTSASSSSAAATTSGSSTGSSTTTTTSSGPAPSSSKTSAAITLATSQFALLCAAVVGIAYLG